MTAPAGQPCSAIRSSPGATTVAGKHRSTPARARGRADLILVSYLGDMDYREAARLASDIGAEVLVPMHWELFAHNRGFPGQLVGYVADRHPGLSVLVMGRGARFAFEPGDSTL